VLDSGAIRLCSAAAEVLNVESCHVSILTQQRTLRLKAETGMHDHPNRANVFSSSAKLIHY
jgi:hypothetical protein